MLRPLPPRIKRYEALGSIADGRTRNEEGEYHVYSSSGNKYYTVQYDPKTKSIMTNDNATYYKGYLGYPALCYLLEYGILDYQKGHAILLKGIYRKQLNTDMNYDFDAVIAHLQKTLPGDREAFDTYIDILALDLKQLKLHQLGEKQNPPEGW